MKTILKKLLIAPLLLLCVLTKAQVKTNFNNETPIDARGRFVKPYKVKIDFEIAAKSIPDLLQTEKKRTDTTKEVQPFQLAVPVSVDLDIVKLTDWNYDSDFAYGKFTIKLNGALSTSINFDRFYLPKGTEMYLYNENGNMITGPVTENENNPYKIWGSWVYRGPFLIIEIKTPLSTLKQLLLHSNNIAYGYKKVYKTQVSGFGQSAACEINIICPLGVGWEGERNSVSLLLSDNGSNWCSGCLVMNTCNTNIPFYLTANHCFNPPGLPQQNVAAWRFTFEAWSPTCTPSQNANGITYNGSALMANSAGTDFCLVELNNTPPNNSGITYAGWSRNTAGITQTTIIHHPAGDVMKITNDINPPAFGNFLGAQCWHLFVDNGTTEGGSSGSPYFDQNHRIIGQHYGIDDGNLPICNQVSKYGGRFDLSWTGGGTNATRLSNWLDPGNSGALTTNTTNISNLLAPNSSLTLNVSGSGNICSGSSTYTLTGAPTGVNINWTISNTSIASLTPNGTQATVTKTGSGNVTLSATVAAGCSYTNNVGSKDIKLGAYSNYEVPISGYTQVPLNYTATYSVDLNKYPITNLVWTWPSGWTYIYGGNGSNYIVLRSPSTASTGDINLSFSACGVNNILSAHWVAWGYGGPSYRITPNPANSILKVEEIDSATNKALAQTNIQTIEIVDKMGNLVYTQNFPKDTPNGMTIPVDKLMNDIYIVRVFNGIVWKSYKIIIQH